MSDLEEDASALGRQRSIFSGMGRVRQINQFREKWSTSRGKGFGDAAAASAWARRGGAKKYSAALRGESERNKEAAGTGSNDRPRLRRSLTASDLERYRSIALWLNGNGIDVVDASQAAAAAQAGGTNVFDDVLDSLDALEKSVESELAQMRGGEVAGGADPPFESDTTANPPICDYVVVVGPDVGDIAARNYWHCQENVFEATVAFAYPPHCQFNAESIEHFCFPRGIKTALDCGDTNAPDQAGEFFVLLLSGGGAQGQSVQYAFCMKGRVRVPSGFDGAQFSLAPICYCIVSQFPLADFFRDVLYRLLAHMQGDADAATQALKCNVVSNEHSHYVDAVFRRLRGIRESEVGSGVTVDAFPPPALPVVLHRPTIDDDKDVLLLQWSLPLLLENLTIDQTLQILALLLTEMKVIVICDQLSLLSSATLGLASMLQPLSWAGPLITILPPFLHEYMEAPVPLICGIDMIPPDFECSPGSGIVHLLDHRIVLHADDERDSDALRIPGADALCRDLDFFTKKISQPTSERIVSFGVDVVIRRVRLHIQQLIDACLELEGTADDSAGSVASFTADELKFMRRITQTQMYQKYRDDHPPAATASPAFKPMNECDKEGCKTADGVRARASHESDKSEFNTAAKTIFRIALTGVNEVDDEPEDPLEYSDVSGYDSSFGDSFQLDSDSAFPIEPSPGGGSDTGRKGKESPRSQTSSPHAEVADAPNPTRSGSDRLDPAATVHDATTVGALCSSVGSDASARQSESSLLLPEHVASSVTLADIEAEISICHADLDHPLQREDTETTMSLLGTTFSEMLLRGGGSYADADWLSESSDGENFHDCQETATGGSDEPNAGTTRLGDCHGSSLLHTTISCVKIQRTWRDWMARRRRSVWRSPPSQLKARRGRTLVYEGAYAHTLHRRVETLHELGVLTRGVVVQQEDASHKASEGRLLVSADVLRLEWWPASETPGDECPDAVELPAIRRISSRVSVSDVDGERSAASWLLTDVYYDGGMWRFRHDMLAQDFFCFLRWVTVSTLSTGEGGSSVSRASSSRSLPASASSNNESHASTPTDHVPIESPSLSSCQDCPGLDSFKSALRSGLLIEKHGRSGKPHAKVLYTDAACTQIMWRKPSASHSADSAVPAPPSALFFQKSLAVASIKAVLGGKQTVVFNRSTALEADEKLCLSVVGATRTLDIRAYSREDYDLLFCGFALLAKLNAALPL